MGLFGPGSSYSRLGAGAEGATARNAIMNIVGPLEAEFQDTPGEYLVLQAAGMLFACEVGAVGGARQVRSMEESLARARQIMCAFVDEPSADAETLESKAVAVYSQLRDAVAKGAQPALLVGHLNDYLHHVDNGYLRRKATAVSTSVLPPDESSFRGPMDVQRGATRMPILALLRFLVLFLFGLGATLLIGTAYPVFLVTTLVLGLVGFRMGKSTKVPANPRDVPFSPMLSLSYREFDRWARQNHLRRTAPAFFSRTDVHWTEKLPVLFSGSDAAGHCFEPSRSTTKLLFVDLALGAFIFLPAIREAFGSLGSGGALFFQFMCGLALGQMAGRATGGFYRWFRGKI